jgi:hypothetical protein
VQGCRKARDLKSNNKKENMSEFKKQPYADIICEHLQTGKPLWKYSFTFEEWRGISWGAVMFDYYTDSYHLAIGEKPTKPPAPKPKVCTLGGIEFPEPMREAPVLHSKCFLAKLEGCDRYHFMWRNYDEDKQWLSSGLIQPTKEGAEAQSRAMRAALAQAISGAK